MQEPLTLKCLLRVQYWKTNPTKAHDAKLMPEAGGITAVPAKNTGMFTNLKILKVGVSTAYRSDLLAGNVRTQANAWLRSRREWEEEHQ